ncbi:MAG TPA: type II toxin-antitoxin system HicA family toxin [Solirubrobacterales bacterium]|jgi:hypothetical protein|nr:type II toxin-antitoxin system HicA family toxin [Solirubrobacterales bacterium]
MLNPGVSNQGFGAWWEETWTHVRRLEPVTIPLAFHNRGLDNAARQIVSTLRRDGWTEHQGAGSNVRFTPPSHHRLAA